MTKKGKVSEIFSKALYNDNSDLYSIGYIDLREMKKCKNLRISKII